MKVFSTQLDHNLIVKMMKIRTKNPNKIKILAQNHQMSLIIQKV